VWFGFRREDWPLTEMYVCFLWVIFLPIWLMWFLSTDKSNYYLPFHKILFFQVTQISDVNQKSGTWMWSDWQNCSIQCEPEALFKNTSESWYAQTQCMSVISFALKVVEENIYGALWIIYNWFCLSAHH
jgi:hypothetical protein